MAEFRLDGREIGHAVDNAVSAALRTGKDADLKLLRHHARRLAEEVSQAAGFGAQDETGGTAMSPQMMEAMRDEDGAMSTPMRCDCEPRAGVLDTGDCRVHGGLIRLSSEERRMRQDALVLRWLLAQIEVRNAIEAEAVAHLATVRAQAVAEAERLCLMAARQGIRSPEGLMPMRPRNRGFE